MSTHDAAPTLDIRLRARERDIFVLAAARYLLLSLLLARLLSALLAPCSFLSLLLAPCFLLLALLALPLNLLALLAPLALLLSLGLSGFPQPDLIGKIVLSVSQNFQLLQETKI